VQPVNDWRKGERSDGGGLEVLIIEDSQDDALLMLREVRKGFRDAEAERVETAAQLQEALRAGRWDVILADYTVPGFGALPALALLNARGLDIPVIIVTGSIDDETAVAAMKAGAKDYVMKDKLKRLLPAIERELREAAVRRQRRQAEEDSGRLASMLTTVIEMLPDMFYIKDLKGKYLRVNSAVEKHFDLPRQEIVGKNDAAFLPADSVVQIRIMEKSIKSSRAPLRYEHSMLRGSMTVFFDTTKVPLTDPAGEVIGIVGFSRDITEKKQTEIELNKRVAQLQAAWGQTIKILSDAVEARDAYTAGHQKKVARLSVAIGRQMGLSADALRGLEMAALVHDIGKIRVPGELLSKPSRLSAAEFALIKEHAASGWEIFKAYEFPWNIAEIIYQHHERMDGSGYPRGLRGGEIMTEARVIAVADVVEAMSAHRPYRPSLGIEHALTEISLQRGKLYDDKVVAACLELFADKRFSFDPEVTA
jgi:PAS domain S-box-containing protein/putative nucleotidyltransferase with HDIG domain